MAWQSQRQTLEEALQNRELYENIQQLAGSVRHNGLHASHHAPCSRPSGSRGDASTRSFAHLPCRPRSLIHVLRPGGTVATCQPCWRRSGPSWACRLAARTSSRRRMTTEEAGTEEEEEGTTTVADQCMKDEARLCTR